MTKGKARRAAKHRIHKTYERRKPIAARNKLKKLERLLVLHPKDSKNLKAKIEYVKKSGLTKQPRRRSRR